MQEKGWTSFCSQSFSTVLSHRKTKQGLKRQYEINLLQPKFFLMLDVAPAFSVHLIPKKYSKDNFLVNTQRNVYYTYR